MLDNLYFQSGHLTNEAFSALDEGLFTPEDRNLMLTHLDNCPECMELWISLLESAPLEEPPDGMAGRILQTVSLERKKRKRSKVIVIQFTKLAVAVGLTVVLGAGGVFEFLISLPKKQVQTAHPVSLEDRIQEDKESQRLREKSTFNTIVNNINSGFNDFANFWNFDIRNIGDEQK